MAHRINLPPNHYWSCRLAITSSFMSSLCSILFILNMTFDRFYSIIKPHKAASFNTLKRAKITIVCIVIFSILYNVPHLFITSNQGHICVPYGSASGPMGQFYYWLSFVIHFAFPFISLVIMNSVIIHTISKSFKVKGKHIKCAQGQGQSEGQIKKFRDAGLCHAASRDVRVSNLCHSRLRFLFLRHVFWLYSICHTDLQDFIYFTTLLRSCTTQIMELTSSFMSFREKNLDPIWLSCLNHGDLRSSQRIQPIYQVFLNNTPFLCHHFNFFYLDITE